MFTREQSQAIADIIYWQTIARDPDKIDKLSFIEQMCQLLKADNPCFDSDKFKEACDHPAK